MGQFTEDDPELAILREDLAWPLELDSDGDLKAVSGMANMESAMVGRAITPLGAIPHRPLYGIDFEELENAPNDDEERAVLTSRLLSQYQRDPRLEEVDVAVNQDADDPSDTIAIVKAFTKTGASAEASVVLTREA